MNFRNTKIALLACLICSAASGSALQYSEYKIEGYRKQISGPQKHMVVEAKSAEGLGEIGFEDLKQAKITIKEKNLSLRLSGNEVLFKPNEILLSGEAEFIVLDKNGKNSVIEVKAMPPENQIYVALDEDSVKVPSALVTWRGTKETGRSLVIDLIKRTFLWIQPSPLKGQRATKF